MTTNELINLLNTVENKDEEIYFTVVTGYDSNGRYNYEYGYKAEIWDHNITKAGPTLVIK